MNLVFVFHSMILSLRFIIQLFIKTFSGIFILSLLTIRVPCDLCSILFYPLVFVAGGIFCHQFGFDDLIMFLPMKFLLVHVFSIHALPGLVILLVRLFLQRRILMVFPKAKANRSSNRREERCGESQSKRFSDIFVF